MQGDHGDGEEEEEVGLVIVGTAQGVGSLIREPAASPGAAGAGAVPLQNHLRTTAGAADGTDDVNVALNAIMNDDDLPALAALAAAAAATGAGALAGDGSAVGVPAGQGGANGDGNVSLMFIRPPPSQPSQPSQPLSSHGPFIGLTNDSNNNDCRGDGGTGGAGLLWAIPIPAAHLAAPNHTHTLTHTDGIDAGRTTASAPALSSSSSAATSAATPAVVAGYADGRVLVWRLDFDAQGKLVVLM